jgi:hypothetical protein
LESVATDALIAGEAFRQDRSMGKHEQRGSPFCISAKLETRALAISNVWLTKKPHVEPLIDITGISTTCGDVHVPNARLRAVGASRRGASEGRVHRAVSGVEPQLRIASC